VGPFFETQRTLYVQVVHFALHNNSLHSFNMHLIHVKFQLLSSSKVEMQQPDSLNKQQLLWQLR